MIQGSLGRSEVAGQRQGSAILLRRSGLVTVLFQQAAEQIVRFECGRLFHGFPRQVSAQQILGLWYIAFIANQKIGGVDEHVLVLLVGRYHMLNGVFHAIVLLPLKLIELNTMLAGIMVTLPADVQLPCAPRS